MAAMTSRLFNNLLRQEELCSCGSGFQIKLGLSQLEEWISKADKNDKKHLSQAAKRYLLHITEAANVLVVDKDIFTDEEMIENVFPTLTVPQIKYLLEHFQTDQYVVLLYITHHHRHRRRLAHHTPALHCRVNDLA
jgi:uncharacterized protein (DUF2235 family)